MTSISVHKLTPTGTLPYSIQTGTFDELTSRLPQGFYTTFRTFGGGKRVLGLQAHLQRLYKPAEVQSIIPSVDQTYLRHQLARVLESCVGESRVRLILTSSGDIYIALAPLVVPPKEVYHNGVKVITTDARRESPRLKSTAFIKSSESIRAQIAKSDIFEGLLVRNDRILEGLTSNFFYVKDGMLGTACKHILLGVTRRTVLRVGRGIGLDILYRSLNREQVPALEEAFLTSSSRGVVPIIQIDEVTVGEGIPGEITKKLISAYNSFVIKDAEII